jgi:phage terminase large subunit-like protein
LPGLSTGQELAQVAKRLIRREWLDLWRLSALPPGLVRTVIGVDPSDSGEGDAAGIVAASLAREGVVVVHREVRSR